VKRDHIVVEIEPLIFVKLKADRAVKAQQAENTFSQCSL
jgi:hypothetical protein